METGDIPKPCAIVLAAEKVAEPCTEDRCAYWEKGCIFAGVESDIVLLPEVAGILLGLRRELEQARAEAPQDGEAALAWFHRRLAAGRE